MSFTLQEERQHAHALIDLLPPAKLGAVRNLLEVFLGQDNDSLGPSKPKPSPPTLKGQLSLSPNGARV